ncbi:MAG: glycosyltransferase [Nitrospinota bacterium]|nr:glycosyltransferase [Nitrospinota bacterium]
MEAKVLIEEWRKGYNNSIESVGWIPHNQMSDFYHRADMCVIPSLWEEPFGIAALEAMAAGVPASQTL